MRVVAVVQARVGSSRFPGKVLKPLMGAPLLARMLERVRAATTLQQVVVATTFEAKDEPIRELARVLGVPCISGHPTDLLDRHVQAGRVHEAEVVVKIPSDCPLIDPRIIDRVVSHFLSNHDRFDFVSNLHPATYPDGNDVEVLPMAVLEEAHAEAKRPHEREHTTPFVWDQPERYRVGNVAWETGLDYSMTHRFTIDYPEDYDFIRAIYEALYKPDATPFSLASILRHVAHNPEVFRINAHLAGVNWYRNHLTDLRTVSRRQTVLFEDD
ncbi:MAG: glycosyltransferase family protein [Myxococcales bacterium]|nr:glycosyltransferase family protein [Myxococcales bacterium]